VLFSGDSQLNTRRLKAGSVLFWSFRLLLDFQVDPEAAGNKI